MLPLEATSDAALVASSLSGDRDAFGHIVARYQRLLCSLAYSATGQLSRSEDLAQEAFIEAWRKLPTLREPDKLRPWLCAILRFKVSRLHRSEKNEPVHHAESLEHAEELPADRPSTPAMAEHNEEQALLWSALEKVPEIYREPLILYYREHHSIEHVAVALDLSEDTVKQRLSRGRKLVQEQVLAFVEGALERTTPTRAFTAAVVAMLPAMVATPTAKAAVIGGATIAHGTTLAKTTSLAMFAASVSSIVSAAITLRANLDQARTPLERRMVVVLTAKLVVGSFAFIGVLWGTVLMGIHLPGWRVPGAFIGGAMILFAVAYWPFALMRGMRDQRRLRSAERVRVPELFRRPVDGVRSPLSEYVSRWKPCGIPFMHFRYRTPDADEPAVVAWIAGGDRAYGFIAAWGGLAVAPISVGAMSAGIISIGALSFGVISLGTLAVGALSIGCIAVAWKAFAWLFGLGWYSAQGGGYTIARIAAEGPLAFAEHANSPTARMLLQDPDAERNQMIFFTVIALATLVPVIGYAREIRKRFGKRQ